MWFAAIRTLMEHPCKVWYGNPVEVWSCVPSNPYISFVPIPSILSRVVYTKTKVDFGRVFCEDNVFVVTPLYIKTLQLIFVSLV